MRAITSNLWRKSARHLRIEDSRLRLSVLIAPPRDSKRENTRVHSQLGGEEVAQAAAQGIRTQAILLHALAPLLAKKSEQGPGVRRIEVRQVFQNGRIYCREQAVQGDEDIHRQQRINHSAVPTRRDC